jgi:hypothetical protein
MNYINKTGFVATKILPNVADTGVNGFEIERDDKINHNYKGKNPELTDKEIISEYKDKPLEKNVDSFLFEFDLGTGQDRFVNNMQSLLNSNQYVITRYFFDKESGKQYCLLEKRIEEKKLAIAA